MVKQNEALKDLPLSELWRLQTDAWQAHLGPKKFRPAFYRGMEDGVDFIFSNLDAELTPELLESIYKNAFKHEQWVLGFILLKKVTTKPLLLAPV